MLKTRIAGTAALFAFGLAAIGGTVLTIAAPANAAPSDAGTSSSASGASPSGPTATSGTASGNAPAGSASGSPSAASSSGSTAKFAGAPSFASMTDVGNSGLNQLDAQMADLQKAMANSSPSDTAVLDALTQKWQGLVQAETGIVKDMGDMMKQISQNFGS
jgi:hypothetical protein